MSKDNYPREMTVPFNRETAAVLTREASIQFDKLWCEETVLKVLVTKEETENGWTTINFDYEGSSYRVIGDSRYENVYFFPEDSAHKIKEQMLKASIEALEEIKGLASGTLASITGQNHYQYLDSFREAFLKKTQQDIKSGKDFFCWQGAWESFRESEEFKSLRVPDRGEE